MGFEMICGYVELERVYCMLSKMFFVGEKGLRLMYVVFFWYMDKMKVLRNVVVCLKDNLLNGNVIGISEDFVKRI